MRTQRETITREWDEHGRQPRRELERINKLHTATLTYRRLTAHIGRLEREAYVLDVGCGWGRLLRQFQKDGYSNLFGIDLTRSLLLRCREFMDEPRVLQGDMEELPFGSRVFEVTYGIRVLHYAASPRSAIREMARVTRPGGRVIVVQPNGLNPWRKLVYRKKSLGVQVVKTTFRAAGLEEVREEYFGFSPPSFAIPGAELGARIPGLRRLAAFYLVAGTVSRA